MQDPLVPVESVPLTALIGYTVRQARGLRFNHVLVKDRPIAGTLKGHFTNFSINSKENYYGFNY